MAGRMNGYGIGEIIDRLSILTLKLLHKPTDDYRAEFSRLATELSGRGLSADALALAAVNGELWAHEDQIRSMRAAPDAYVDQDIIRVAFGIQELNDRRAALIQAINEGCSD